MTVESCLVVITQNQYTRITECSGKPLPELQMSLTHQTSLVLYSDMLRFYSHFLPARPSLRYLSCLPSSIHLVIIVLTVQNPQNSQEQVDDVQIQADCSSNLLLNMVMSHDKLRVHQDVPAEDQAGNDAVSQLHRAAMREERRHEPKHNQQPQRCLLYTSPSPRD